MTIFNSQAMPTVAELVGRAIRDTDFNAETPRGTSQREVYRAATIATNQAAEAWEDDASLPIGATVPDSIRNAVAMDLLVHAYDGHAAMDALDAAALADGIESGDLDRDGAAIGYDVSRSAA